LVRDQAGAFPRRVSAGVFLISVLVVQRPVRQCAETGTTQSRRTILVPSLLLGPGVGQPLREPRNGGVSRHTPVGDCSNDPRGNEGERRQNADVALAKTFAFGNLGQRCDAAEPKLFDPTAGLGDGGEQSIAGLGCRRRRRGGPMHDTFTVTKAGASQGSISGMEVGLLASSS
jgi:hypothetical protein